jgi:hypothetical protein
MVESPNLPLLKLEAHGRHFRRLEAGLGSADRAQESSRFLHVAPRALLIGVAESMQPHSFTSILTSHRASRMHAFVELPSPNVTLKLLAIALTMVMQTHPPRVPSNG